LIKNLNRKIKTVGVFVNEDVEKVRFIAEKLELDILQLHGNEDRNYIDKLSGFEIWKAISIKNTKDLNILKMYEKETVLLDSKVLDMQGGTGITFDWNMIKGLSATKQLVLAGGLNEWNVKEAIEIVKPYAVDVSSGVENLGFKNFTKIEQFIRKVRQI
jgi:phosphoribosylanthranilate isomerase